MNCSTLQTKSESASRGAAHAVTLQRTTYQTTKKASKESDLNYSEISTTKQTGKKCWKCKKAWNLQHTCATNDLKGL